MKKITLLVLLTLGLNSSLNAQQWNWVTVPTPQDDGMGYVYPSAIGVDTNGNSYINCVSTCSSISFGENEFAGADAEFGRNFLVKYDISGNVVWVKDVVEDEIVYTEAIATDEFGNFYTTGYFTDHYTIEGITLESDSGSSTFINKFNANGDLLWAIKADAIVSGGDFSYLQASDIVLDQEGSIYVTGSMRGDVANFGNISVDIPGEVDLFIAKYDNNGNILWVWTAEGDDLPYFPPSLVYDVTGNLYIGGNFTGTLAIGETILGEENTFGTYLAKFNTDGELLWLNSHSGGEDNVGLLDIDIDAGGNIYTCGYFTSTTLSINAISLTNTAAADAGSNGFVAKYNSSGEAIWAKAVNGNYYTDVQSLFTDSNGKIYLTGNFLSTQLAFGDSILLTNEGIMNSYLAQMDSEGNYLSTEHIGGEYTFSRKIRANNDNSSVYMAGSYSNARFGDQYYTSPLNDGNMFHAKYDLAELSGKDFAEVQLVLYPNPVQNILNFAGNFAGNVTYTIDDIAGRTVKTGSLENAIDVSALSHGIYAITINGIKHRFIKE